MPPTSILIVNYPDGSRITRSSTRNPANGIYELNSFGPATHNTARNQTLHFTSSTAPNGNGGNVATPPRMTQKIESGH